LTARPKGSIITLTTTTGTAMKTNKEKNIEHDAKMKARIRPKPVEYNWEALDAVIKQWKANARSE
jgi:hypothetical protein